MANQIREFDDTIDSRDVDERIDELQSEADDARDSENEDLTFCQMTKSEYRAYTSAWLRGLGLDRTADETEEHFEAEMGLDDDETRELADLTEFKDDAEGYCDDWEYGATLVNEDYFTEYAQQLAEDIGAIGNGASWPADHINWEAAAQSLMMDYTTVEYRGATFYVR